VIENQKEIDSYLLSSSVHHFKAINYHEEGDYKKATESDALAKEFLRLANELKIEDIPPQVMAEIG